MLNLLLFCLIRKNNVFFGKRTKCIWYWSDTSWYWSLRYAVRWCYYGLKRTCSQKLQYNSELSNGRYWVHSLADLFKNAASLWSSSIQITRVTLYRVINSVSLYASNGFSRSRNTCWFAKLVAVSISSIKKNIKLPPVPPPLPLVALFVPILLGIVPPKALAESQGVILYFSTKLVGILLEKNKHNQLRIYKFYEIETNITYKCNFSTRIYGMQFW